MSLSLTLTQFVSKCAAHEQHHFKLNPTQKASNKFHLWAEMRAKYQTQHSAYWAALESFTVCSTETLLQVKQQLVCASVSLWGWRLQKINLWNDPQRKESQGAALSTHPCILVVPFLCCHWSPFLWLSLSPSKRVTINHLLFSSCLCCFALPLSLFPLPPWELRLTMHNRISGSVRVSFQQLLLSTYKKMFSLYSYRIFFSFC